MCVACDNIISLILEELGRFGPHTIFKYSAALIITYTVYLSIKKALSGSVVNKDMGSLNSSCLQKRPPLTYTTSRFHSSTFNANKYIIPWFKYLSTKKEPLFGPHKKGEELYRPISRKQSKNSSSLRLSIHLLLFSLKRF